jgi:hypothetical protein
MLKLAAVMTAAFASKTCPAECSTSMRYAHSRQFNVHFAAASV